MKKTILLAEDDATLLELVSVSLEQFGYEVVRAADGAEAMAKIRERAPDLILLDYFMPGLSGEQVCRAVKEDPALKSIPVVLLSASMAALAPEKVESIPCDERMTKPFDIVALADTIAALLSRGR